MNILITGANGLLGRYLVNHLSRTHIVYAVVKNKDIIRFSLNTNVKIVELDLTYFDPSILPNSIDAVFYLAQSNLFREFPAGINDMLAVNVVAPNAVAKWAAEHGVKRFIFASSGGVYTNLDKPVKEFFDINANEKLGFYLNSKLSAEMLLKNFSSLFECFTIIRPFFIYGVGQNENMLIPRLVNSVKNEKEITLSGSVGIKINPVYVSDAVEAVSSILNLDGEHVINIAGSEAVSLRQLCETIGVIVGKQPSFSVVNKIQPDLIADISLMRDMLNEPQVGLKLGIQNLVNSL